MLSRPPLPYEKTDVDSDNELRGTFTVLHEKGLEFDSTYNRPSLLTLDLCQVRPLRWLWEDKIPRGKLTLIEGPPAVGKLFVALDLAASVTRECREEKGERRTEEVVVDGAVAGGVPLSQGGATPPGPPFLRGGEHGSGAPVVLVCDSWQAQDMIGARMRALGADLRQVVMFNRVICTDTCGGHKHSRPIRLPLDGQMLEYIVNKHRGCRMIVIDDLEQYCETPAELRRAIRELDEAAIYFNIAIVATLQANVRFAPDGTIRDAARASDCQARCIWCVTPDPTHPGLLRMEPKRMAFCKKPEGIAFRISDAGTLVWEPLPPYEKPRTEAARRKEHNHARMLTWLGETLATEVVLAETIYDAGREHGYSKNKLIAAREEIKARTFKYGFGHAGAWMWTMKPPAEVNDEEVEAAYLLLEDEPSADAPHPAPHAAPHPQALSPEGERGEKEVGAEGSTGNAQNGENFGVLRQKRGKNGDSRQSGEDQNSSRFYDGLSMEQLGELALQQLGVGRGADEVLLESAECHVGNGHG